MLSTRDSKNMYTLYRNRVPFRYEDGSNLSGKFSSKDAKSKFMERLKYIQDKHAYLYENKILHQEEYVLENVIWPIYLLDYFINKENIKPSDEFINFINNYKEPP